MNINVHANQKADNTYTNVRQKKGQAAGSKRKNIDGSAIAFNQGTESAIARKRKLAQEKAMRLISRAWDKDKAVAQGLQDKQELIDAKTKKNAERSSQLKDIETQKQSMQEEYGITADSQEQKDLELLEKYQNYKQGNFSENFSKEEIERLKELQNVPMTDYQKQVLSLNRVANQISTDMNQDTASIEALTNSIRDERINQLGSQDMVNAKEAADAVMDAANQEILGMLMQEAKDHIDEKAEEEQKRAEEVAKEKEAEEEKLEKAKEKRENAEELVKGEIKTEQLEQEQQIQQQSDRHTKEAQKNIRKIIKQSQLIDEDLKGIEIDFDF